MVENLMHDTGVFIETSTYWEYDIFKKAFTKNLIPHIRTPFFFFYQFAKSICMIIFYINIIVEILVSVLLYPIGIYITNPTLSDINIFFKYGIHHIIIHIRMNPIIGINKGDIFMFGIFDPIFSRYR